MDNEQLILQIIKDVQDHTTVMNNELSQIIPEVAVLKTQVAEIMWTGRIILAALIGLIVETIWRHFGKKHDNA